jgi:hypothetical protein
VGNADVNGVEVVEFRVFRFVEFGFNRVQRQRGSRFLLFLLLGVLPALVVLPGGLFSGFPDFLDIGLLLQLVTLISFVLLLGVLLDLKLGTVGLTTVLVGEV